MPTSSATPSRPSSAVEPQPGGHAIAMGLEDGHRVVGLLEERVEVVDERPSVTVAEQLGARPGDDRLGLLAEHDAGMDGMEVFQLVGLDERRPEDQPLADVEQTEAEAAADEEPGREQIELQARGIQEQLGDGRLLVTADVERRRQHQGVGEERRGARRVGPEDVAKGARDGAVQALEPLLDLLRWTLVHRAHPEEVEEQDGAAGQPRPAPGVEEDVIALGADRHDGRGRRLRGASRRARDRATARAEHVGPRAVLVHPHDQPAPLG